MLERSSQLQCYRMIAYTPYHLMFVVQQTDTSLTIVQSCLTRRAQTHMREARSSTPVIGSQRFKERKCSFKNHTRPPLAAVEFSDFCFLPHHRIQQQNPTGYQDNDAKHISLFHQQTTVSQVQNGITNNALVRVSAQQPCPRQCAVLYGPVQYLFGTIWLFLLSNNIQRYQH